MVQVDDAFAAQVEAIMTRPRAVGPLPEPAYDMEYVADTRNPAQEAAAIHRAERTVQYKSE